MPDREKVIKGLKNLRDAIATDFIHEADQAVGTIDDALTLLKEQEAVVPEVEGSSNTWWHVCGNCHTGINPNAKYCHQCGKAVKWDG